MTQAELTAFIDANIRNKTPKVVKVEHADVEQEITDTLFDNVNTLVNSIASLQTSINTINAKMPLNSGKVEGINPNAGTVGASSTVAGNIVSCILNTVGTSGNTYTVTLTNAMPSTNYSVFFTCESKSGNMLDDNNIGSVVFKPLTTTTFQFSLTEIASTALLIDLHLKVYNNTEIDEIYVSGWHTAWTIVGKATVTNILCLDCYFWHLIGDM